MKKMKKFFDEVKKELGKVKWPNKKDMVKYSIATICFVIFFAVFFYLIDLGVAAIKALV
jgi:preprotein translocase subunit SecE